MIEGPSSASTPGGPPIATTDHADGVRPCRTRTEGSRTFEFDKKHDIRIGRVIFFGLGGARASFAPARDYRIKSVIAVRAGKAVMLRIPPGARDEIALAYAANRDGSMPAVRRVDDGQSVVLLKPCSERTRRASDGRRIGRWTKFSGGFVFREVGCYPVEVSGSGKEWTRKMIAFGTRCGSGYADNGPR